MAINNPEITAIDHGEDLSTAIDILTSRPSISVLAVAVNPGRLIGYYNAGNDAVELYVADQNGLRWIPVSNNV